MSSYGTGQFDGFKYSGNQGDSKQRMAGDYLKEFTDKYSDNTNRNIDYNTAKNSASDKKAPESNINKLLFNNAESFGPKGDQTPMGTVPKKPEGEVTAQPVGDSTPASSNQQKYTVDQIYDKYAKLDQAQTGSGASKNQGSIALYYQGQEEIKNLRRQGLLIDENGNVIPDT